MYTSYYQLKEEPFRLTPDPRYLHLAAPHRTALVSLVQGVVTRKGFLTMCGPAGTGKTTILHAGMQILGQPAAKQQPLASAFIVNPTLTRDEFLELLLEEFEVSCPSTSKPRRLMALQQMILETQRRGGTSVLIIDEAHLLSIELLEEIRLLGNADTYKEKPLQIILSGQPEFLGLLREPRLTALRQRIAGGCNLRALSLPEVRVYIAERLHSAGWRGKTLFTEAALGGIFKSSEGVPRLINLLCDSCLTFGFAAQRPQIDADIVEEAITALGLIQAEAPIMGEKLHLANEDVPYPREDKLFESTFGRLIEVMKHGRASARE